MGAARRIRQRMRRAVQRASTEQEATTTPQMHRTERTSEEVQAQEAAELQDPEAMSPAPNDRASESTPTPTTRSTP